jgi:hypothetical protein
MEISKELEAAACRNNRTADRAAAHFYKKMGFRLASPLVV